MRKRGNTLIEYAFIIAAVSAACLGMFYFFRLAVQQRYKQSVDVFGGGKQYNDVNHR